MAFVDELRNMNVTTEQRIDATCHMYVDRIVAQIRFEAKRCAKNGQSNIRGYIMRDINDGVGNSKVKELGDIAFRDVYDFGIVYSDLNCTGYNSNDKARITKEQFEKSVLAKVRSSIVQDGFNIKELRADTFENYHYVTKSGLIRDKRIREYEGTTAVFCYVHITW